MNTDRRVLKRRVIAVLALLLADLILYAAGGWVIFKAMGGEASFQPFMVFAFALGIVVTVLVLATCDGRFDAKLSNVLN